MDAWIKLSELVAVWASAFAAGGAAIAALWIADRDRRERATERVSDGRIVREVIRPEIERFLNSLVDASNALDAIAKGHHFEDEKPLHALKLLADSLSLETTKSERSNFRSLTTAEADAAARLIGQLPMLRETMGSFALNGKTWAFIVFNRERLKLISSAARTAGVILGLPNNTWYYETIEHGVSFPEPAWWTEELNLIRMTFPGGAARTDSR